MESDCPGVKRKCKRRSRRGGKKVQERRRKAIARELEASRAQNPASNPAPVHVEKPTAPEPEVIDICDSDTETVVVSRPQIPVVTIY
ncbi:hypothetical protein WH47_06858 [Habropoda laboriosa]|uniref:Uncharacterized protein n=1 Tax=Habropoda laboriosa TaxID=597456 RepID=A0A0L7QIZ1_9HYME|nr:hypothetical protein WH47_06858 [Habropoda laboriosa]